MYVKYVEKYHLKSAKAPSETVLRIHPAQTSTLFFHKRCTRMSHKEGENLEEGNKGFLNLGSARGIGIVRLDLGYKRL